MKRLVSVAVYLLFLINLTVAAILISRINRPHDLQVQVVLPIETEKVILEPVIFEEPEEILSDKVLNAIIQTESEGNPNAISFLGYDYGIGLMQVSKIALLDYNLWNGTSYTQEDLFNPDINVMIGSWIFMHNTHYGVPEELSALLTAYNCGAKYYKNYGIRDSYVNKILDNLLGDLSEL